ncbi:MAG: PAS domain S-box protein [Candidatus Latescibacteria bacterium]|nr:PAS domain S-box protein [Candidatus Latescibacterota bacterium]
MQTSGASPAHRPVSFRHTITCQALVLGLLLIAGRWVVSTVSWRGTPTLHVSLEFIAGLLALVIALGGIVRYVAFKQRLVLLFGLSFMGASIVDLLHAEMSLRALAVSEGPDPVTWTAGRVTLSLFLIAGLLVDRYAPHARRVRTELLTAVTVTVGVTWILVLLLNWYIQRRATIFANMPSLGWVSEWGLVPVFLGIAWGYWRAFVRQRSSYLDWASASAVIFCITQVYSATNVTVHQFTFVASHFLKDFGYLIALIGLYVESLALFRDLEQQQGALRQAEEKYRSIFENAVEGIFQSTPDGRFLTANPAMARMLGYDSPEEFITTITDAERQLHVRPELRQEFKRLIEEQKVVHEFEFNLYRKDRSTMWASLHARAVRDEQGMIRYYEGTAEDVTEHKRAAERLQEAYQHINDQNQDLERSNRRLATLLDVSRMMATVHSLDALLQSILVKATELIPLARAGVLMLYDPVIDRLVPHATIGYQLGILSDLRLRPGESFPGRVFATGQPYMSQSPEELASTMDELNDEQRRLVGQAAAGLPPSLGMMCAPLVVQGKPIGVMMVNNYASTSPFTADHLAFFQALCSQVATAIRNVQLYDEVQEYAGQLDQKNEELESFVYTVSHDLRSPLVSLHGLMGMFVKAAGSALDERGRRYLARLEANVSQMEELIDGLLELSRVGRMAVQMEDLDMNRLVGGVIEQLRPQFDATGIAVTVHPLPRLSASALQMKQVFSNLIGNAIKFMGDAPDRRIEVGGELLNGAAQFYVKDTGIGIDPAYHEKIFAIFQRLQELEGVTGTGVGLAIVKKIIDNAHGTIAVESERGKGATFRFTVPSGKEAGGAV